MLQDFLIALVLAFIAFEVIEHVLLPIFWFLVKGIVLFHAERWQAVSEYPLLPGEKAIVEEVSGLTLRINPCMDTVCHDNVK